MNGQLRSWLKPVANKNEYLAALRAAIKQMHNCESVWLKTEPVHEVFKGQTVWRGDVEVFSLFGHPKAMRAYAWARLEGDKDETTKFTAVLEIPPVKDSKTAVQASIMASGQTPQS
jgi:hypothetical protein